MPKLLPPLTTEVPLPGGVLRLRQLILYVAAKCQGAEYFGATKLNKILWKADFDAFAARGVPVTGREYWRQQTGPAPREMLPLHRAMLAEGTIRIDRRACPDGRIEYRTIPVGKPAPGMFSDEELGFVNAAIRHYWLMTATESSDPAHGIAWRTRRNGDTMPYELALLADAPVDAGQLRQAEVLIYENGWASE